MKFGLLLFGYFFDGHLHCTPDSPAETTALLFFNTSGSDKTMIKTMILSDIFLDKTIFHDHLMKECSRCCYSPVCWVLPVDAPAVPSSAAVASSESFSAFFAQIDGIAPLKYYNIC